MKIYQYRLDIEELPRPKKSNCTMYDYDYIIGNIPIKFPFETDRGIIIHSLEELLWIEIRAQVRYCCENWYGECQFIGE